MHCAGNDDIITPNLDRLAESGILFENNYCVSPVCSPARASLMTGKIPSEHGVHDWLAKGQVDEASLAPDLIREFYSDNTSYYYEWPKCQLKGDSGIEYLKPHKTFPEVLADNGYECGISGKWHIGAANRPQCGFKFWRTCAIGGGEYYHQVMLDSNGVMQMYPGEYITDKITDVAFEFLNTRDSEKPFCLCVNYTAPHSPWGEGCHPKEYEELYKDILFDSIPEEEPHKWVGGVDIPFDEWKKKPHPGVRFINAKYAPIRETWHEYRMESLRGYFAAVTAMDANVGRLLDYLEENDLREDTLVVFTSDNGSNMGHHGIFGKGNGTYPMNMYDTSVKVPGIFSCPGSIPEGVRSTRQVSHYDYFHTLLDFVGVDFKKSNDMPGESFAEHLRTLCEDASAPVVVYEEYGPARMIRSKEFKLVRRSIPNTDELYDLRNDPDERQNLIDDPSYADVISELDLSLIAWFDRYVDPQFDGYHEKVTGKGQKNAHDFIQ